MLAGRGGGFFTPGRTSSISAKRRCRNLFATMAQRMGVTPEHIGDSTGPLAELSLS